MIALSACSPDSAVTSIDANQISSTVPTVSPAPDESLPSLPPIAEEQLPDTRAILQRQEISDWLIAAVSISALDPASFACDSLESAPEQLAGDVLFGVVDIPEATLQELLLNLDSAIGASAILCRSGDIAGAAGEWATAISIAQLIDQRLAEIS